MATKLTHTFKQVSGLELKADIYLRSLDAHRREYNRSQPVVLYFHGGGFVFSDREDVPPHIVQLCLMRGWVLVSADYRKLPQISGTEMWEDARDAFVFVRETLPGILAGRLSGARFENVVLVGRSAGAYLSYLCGHNMDPKPIAMLTYYGVTSMSDPFFHSSFQMGPAPIGWERVKPFYSEDVTLGTTLPSKKFDPDCLLPDLTRNPAWKRPHPEPGPHPRIVLVPWFFQENQYPEMMQEVDKSLDDKAWTEFPPTILVHGDKDVVNPYECSVRLVEAIGVPPAKLFTAVGQGHGFDELFFSGEPGLSVVEEAWITLDEAVKARLKTHDLS
ncbi:alpha/beta-hydrolase [Mollisia scopiformis]|uniref:Alpha/beta-hydrolase n=1 Tax=Mollisia scopiformis TaxID=149040 RepID=A0A194X2A5_MOLSC|nr:alpha/beta-hydrolase [Mollisia scopiformis]KUJ14331.1 alpha/beta-hydrolase [Mollisia scopiformis]